MKFIKFLVILNIFINASYAQKFELNKYSNYFKDSIIYDYGFLDGKLIVLKSFDELLIENDKLNFTRYQINYPVKNYDGHSLTNLEISNREILVYSSISDYFVLVEDNNIKFYKLDFINSQDSIYSVENIFIPSKENIYYVYKNYYYDLLNTIWKSTFHLTDFYKKRLIQIDSYKLSFQNENNIYYISQDILYKFDEALNTQVYKFEMENPDSKFAKFQNNDSTWILSNKGFLYLFSKENINVINLNLEFKSFFGDFIVYKSDVFFTDGSLYKINIHEKKLVEYPLNMDSAFGRAKIKNIKLKDNEIWGVLEYIQMIGTSFGFIIYPLE